MTPKSPWYHRLQSGLFPISDRAFALLFLAIVLTLGMLIGTTLCLFGHGR